MSQFKKLSYGDFSDSVSFYCFDYVYLFHFIYIISSSIELLVNYNLSS